MPTGRQYIGTGIIGAEGILLFKRNELLVEHDKFFHFMAGIGIGLITKNPVAQASAIIGWEVIEPLIYLLKYKQPIAIPSMADPMKDIAITALGTYISSKYLHGEDK